VDREDVGPLSVLNCDNISTYMSTSAMFRALTDQGSELGHIVSAERELITGVWGHSPGWGLGAEPLARRSVVKAP